jgi:hypothetical protein
MQMRPNQLKQNGLASAFVDLAFVFYLHFSNHLRSSAIIWKKVDSQGGGFGATGSDIVHLVFATVLILA